jgi:hypothetical protein
LPPLQAAAAEWDSPQQNREIDSGFFIVLSIRDYGPGVPESKLINIFHFSPFIESQRPVIVSLVEPVLVWLSQVELLRGMVEQFAPAI